VRFDIPVSRCEFYGILKCAGKVLPFAKEAWMGHQDKASATLAPPNPIHCIAATLQHDQAFFFDGLGLSVLT
jgi:hypothetical protein